MIQNIRHRGLRRLYERGERRHLRPDQVDKIERILARLDEATEVSHMDLPGFRLHPLRGDLAGFWAVTVSANWRIIFRFEAGHAYDVDLVDYH
jgi:proteic killer suppression protein